MKLWLGPVRKATRWVGRNLLHNRHETPRRADRPGVGAAGAAPTTREAGDGPAEYRPSTDHHRDLVARADWSTVARPAGAVWAMVDGVQPVLARGRDLGSAPDGGPAGGGYRRGGGLERRLRGRDRDSRAPARGWGQGGRQQRRRSDEVRVVLVPRSTSRRMVPASL